MASSIPIKYEQFLNSSPWTINGALIGTTSPGQNGPSSNGNEEWLHTPSRLRIGHTHITHSHLLKGEDSPVCLKCIH